MPWFGEWVKHHATVFGLHAEADVMTLLSWEPLFVAAGYTSGDLHAATDWLAVNAPPKFRTEHLGAIQSRIRDTRAVAYRAEMNAGGEDRGTCTLCGGTGRVVVPHVAGVRDGQWVPIDAARGGASYYTMAVLCRCALGAWVLAHNEEHLRERVPGKRLVTLGEYEQRNPRWRVQREQRRREQRERAALGRPPAPDLAAVVARLRAWYGLEEGA